MNKILKPPQTSVIDLWLLAMRCSSEEEEDDGYASSSSSEEEWSFHDCFWVYFNKKNRCEMKACSRDLVHGPCQHQGSGSERVRIMHCAVDALD